MSVVYSYGIIPYMYVRAAFVVSLCPFLLALVVRDCTAVCAW